MRWKQGFHGLKAVAQLKLLTRLLQPLHRKGFHGLKAVAQLKLVQVRRLRALLRRFPRPQSRGPIEALSATGPRSPIASCFHGLKAVAQLKHGPPRAWRPAHHPGFHGLKAVAQLKRSGPPDPRRPVGEFPRPQSRGPIEATRPGSTRTSHSPRFHGLKAVAQLKPGRVAQWHDLPAGFHGLKAVAQLKRGDQARARGRRGLISTASKPWPN